MGAGKERDRECMDTMNTKGKIANLRRVVSHLDAVLSLYEDDRSIGIHDAEAQSIQELIQDVTKARMCAHNMLSVYDDSDRANT